MTVSEPDENVARSLVAVPGRAGILVVWTSDVIDEDEPPHDTPYTPPTKIRARLFRTAEGTLGAAANLGLGYAPAAVEVDGGFVVAWLSGSENDGAQLTAAKLTAEGTVPAGSTPVRMAVPPGYVAGPTLVEADGRAAAYLCARGGDGILVAPDLMSGGRLRLLARMVCEEAPLIVANQDRSVLAVVSSIAGAYGGLGTPTFRVAGDRADLLTTVDGTAEALLDTPAGVKLLYSTGSDDQVFMLDVDSGRRVKLDQPGGGNRTNLAAAALPSGLVTAWLASDAKHDDTLNVAMVSSMGRTVGGATVVARPYWWLDPVAVFDHDELTLFFVDRVETEPHVFGATVVAQRLNLIQKPPP